jgi:acyl-CoA reductase-like NAD-dependent aldehyde dehydrogenase
MNTSIAVVACAACRCGGKAKSGKGYYVEPTVFTDVKDSMKISREEIFGPVQCISKWSKMDEVGS